MGQVWEQPQGWVQNPWLVTARGQKLPSSRRGEGMEQWCQPETQKALWEERAAWQGLSGGWRRPTVWKTLQAAGAGGDAFVHLTLLCPLVSCPPTGWTFSEVRGQGRRARQSFLLSPWYRAGGDGWGGENPKGQRKMREYFQKPLNKVQCKKGPISDI